MYPTQGLGCDRSRSCTRRAEGGLGHGGEGPAVCRLSWAGTSLLVA